MSDSIERRLLDHLTCLYGAEQAPAVLERLLTILVQFQQRDPLLHTAEEGLAHQERMTERDVVLITYGDQMTEPGKPPLQTLTDVLDKYVKGVITSVHILPFFPFSSDDGFSVIDHTAVNPELGTWADVERLGHSFRLMFDLVVNHTSAQGHWFQEFLSGEVFLLRGGGAAAAGGAGDSGLMDRAEPKRCQTLVRTGYAKRS